MLKIKISDVDELFDLSAKLGVITYLQSLVKYDIDGGLTCDKRIDFVYKYADAFLFDIQYETMIALRQLIEREDFTQIS